jgi:hypothetical protein
VLAVRSTPLAIRRRAVIASPVLAGIFLILGALFDPAAGQDGRDLYERYAAEPERVQWKSVSYHFAYLLWAPVVFSLVGLVRGRGGWLANVAGLLGILGLTTLPGLLFIDYYDSTIGSELGVDAVVRVNDAIESGFGPGVAVITIPAVAGFALSLPLSLVAAWRARLLPLWPAAAVVVGLVGWTVSGVTLWGAVVFALMLAGVSFALSLIDERTWDIGRPARATHSV